MARQEPVRYICQTSDYVSGDAEGTEFIRYVDGKEPQIHEVWAFSEDVVMREVHPTSRLDVSAGVVGKFATDCLTEIWHMIPIFGRISINGSVEWLSVPEFHRTDGPAWTANLLDTCSSW